MLLVRGAAGLGRRLSLQPEQVISALVGKKIKCLTANWQETYALTEDDIVVTWAVNVYKFLYLFFSNFFAYLRVLRLLVLPFHT